MTKIYLYKSGSGACCMTDDGTIANDAAIHSGFAVYALDVEEHVPTPPKTARWVVVDVNGNTLKRIDYSSHIFRVTDDAVSCDRESDAIILKDVLTRGGMTGLTVRKIEE